MTMNNQNGNIDAKKTAMKIYITLAAILLALMYLSLIIFCISHIVFFDKILTLNSKYYGTITLAMWTPFFLFIISIVIYMSFLGPLILGPLNKTNKEEVFKETDFRDILNELRKPTLRKNKRRKILFWIFLALSIVSLITSQIFLYIGMAYL